MNRQLSNEKTNTSMKYLSFFLASLVFFQSAFAGYIGISEEKAIIYPNYPIAKSEAKENNIGEQIQKVQAYKAIPGGPDQPEVQSFTPISASDMVSPFSGDFSYNIPLMDIDGYPINLAYNAGISMDQEATWVGLGWNLNPGVVSRAMRGIPDEFNGTDQIKREFSMRPNWTVGGSFGVSTSDIEIVGFPLPKGFTLGGKLGVSYNNYNGFGADITFKPSLKIGDGEKTHTIGLGISGSSTGGASLTPQYSFARKADAAKGEEMDRKHSVGSSINSRQGLGDLHYSFTKVKKWNTKNLENRPNNAKLDGKNARTFSSSFNFGMSTYTPSIALPMKTFGLTFSFRTGMDALGVDPSLSIQGYFSRQTLRENERSLNAYGYQNLALGENDENGLLDFNRENDGPFTKNTPALAIPTLTYDMFNISGQGVSGSYRMQRTDIGYVFDPKEKEREVSGSAGFELNMGGTSKAGLDLGITYVGGNSGVWDAGNDVLDNMRFVDDHIYFREANEMSVAPDVNHFKNIGGAEPVRFDNNDINSLKNVLEFGNGEHLDSQPDYNREGVEKQNQVVYTLTREELIKKNYGLEVASTNLYQPSDPDVDINHHIGQITTLDQEGKRYVYGIAAYNTLQKEVGFSTDTEPIGNLVAYTPGAHNSKNNSWGTDHYFNAVTTSPFAHSFLLTAVLGSDYIDSDDTKGPSRDDKGYYVKFGYKKLGGTFGWRNPPNNARALYDEGLNTNPGDNKGNYTYGEKELWYLDEIRTKNYIAIFIKGDRNDAVSVTEDGNPGGIKMQRLNKIILYSLADYEKNGATGAVPIKTVHFEYTYALCPNYPLNLGSAGNNGKLTLKSVYFTYQKSERGSRSPYIFSYHGDNGQSYAYDGTKVDRWGNYSSSTGTSMKSSDFPYVGMNRTLRDDDAKAWNLNQIILPSHGVINVVYEADDYGYVQHLPANQMFRIMGVLNTLSTNAKFDGSARLAIELDDIVDAKNASLICEVSPEDASNPNFDMSKYINVGEQLFFRASMKMDAGKFDFVPGYAEVAVVDRYPANGQNYLKLTLKPTGMKDDNGPYNPIVVAAVQYARLHLSSLIPPANQEGLDEGADFLDLAKALYGAYQSFGEIFKGPNKAVYDHEVGVELEVGKSYVRLRTPNHNKLGGGHRVKQIIIKDAWDAMTGNAESTYGQNYNYNYDNGETSGVAAYEPQLGGDENVWKNAEANDKKVLLAPDVRNYQLTPFGESYFPAASVGYAKVTITDILPANVNKHATGKVVHEFYTARDFPTIVKRTNPQIQRFKLPVFAYFVSFSIDELSSSQGFVIENNDMHGKPKLQQVYAQGQPKPISQVRYEYQTEAIVQDGVSVLHLVNDIKVINPDGTIGSSTVGIVYDGVADFRRFVNNSVSATISGNLNFTAPVIVLPSILGSGEYERTAFRSATFTKSIHRFGILKRTSAMDLGSEVETNHLAYDSETGVPLVTQTTTNFNDKIYSFTYPAHWYYEGMGQAYKNVNKFFEGPFKFIYADGVAGGGPDAGKTFSLNSSDGFFEGDEVMTTFKGTSYLAWVIEATPQYIRLIDKEGKYYNAMIDDIKIIRSGRRNVQGTPIGTLTLKTNPINGLSGNVFENVLDAAAIEFKDDWRTDCNCEGVDVLNATTNPFILGIKGTWRPSTNYTHLTDRFQTFTNENSNIRVDGIFRSFNPFYRVSGAKWKIDKRNWTYISSIVDFNPNGMPLETVDALNRYSSTRYGFNSTLQTAVAANTRYQELAFNSYEDNTVDGCDGPFAAGDNTTEIIEEGHTGKNSLKLSGTLLITPGGNACDPQICEIDLNYTAGNIEVIRGQAPYQFEYEIISGEPTINLIDNGNKLSVGATGSWKLRVTVTDANACAKTKEITN